MKSIKDQTPMPKLKYNVKLILAMVEADIEKFDQNLRLERARVKLFKKNISFVPLQDQWIAMTPNISCFKIIVTA